LARLLERRGRFGEAGDQYLAALDHDGLPLRCPAPFRAAIVEVAKRHPRSILIDGRRELMALSADGLIGDKMIHDTHHPTLQSYLALAGSVLRELERREVFGKRQAVSLPLDANACSIHFGMDAERWRDVCDRVSQHYKRIAGYRYDPAERLEKSRRYAEAARRIGSGEAISDLGLPVVPTAATPPQKVRNGNPAVSEHGRAVMVTPNEREPDSHLPTAHSRSLGDDFDLPIFQINCGATAQKLNGSDELVSVRTADHRPDHSHERPSRDSDRRPDWYDVFGGDRQAGTEHRVNLLEVAREPLLVFDVEHTHQAMSTQGRQPGVSVAF
jgi:hypothetical protein